MLIQKILVVDDSATERFHLTEALTKSGYSVSCAETGEEALLRIRADRPHLVLMDVVMPGQNGFQVTRTITRDPDLADLPVIICSSKGQETDRVWGLRQGACEYLVKPISVEALLARIDALKQSDG